MSLCFINIGTCEGRHISLLDEFPEISGNNYPDEDELIFLSGQQIIRYDGKNIGFFLIKLQHDV